MPYTHASQKTYKLIVARFSIPLSENMLIFLLLVSVRVEIDWLAHCIIQRRLCQSRQRKTETITSVRVKGTPAHNIPVTLEERPMLVLPLPGYNETKLASA